MQQLGGSAYSVAFDPLDGSSIIGANWSVGSIIGVWPGNSLLGRTGREQIASAYAVYGPRTTLVVARPSSATGKLPWLCEHMPDAVLDTVLDCQLNISGRHTSNYVALWLWYADSGTEVQEFVLSSADIWVLSRGSIRIGEKKVFAPANLRCTADNTAYMELVHRWMDERLTLRYSGGMVVRTRCLCLTTR